MTEVFDGIQGEGQDTGKPCTFVRLSGCNLRCEWCDTKYAQVEGVATDVADIAAQCGYRVCVTGGEPLLQDIAALAGVFANRRDISVETNGTIKPPAWARKRATDALSATTGILWSVSPKFGSSGMCPDIATLAEWCALDRVQLKFVFSGESDLQEARSLVGTIPGAARHPIYLQPNGREWLDLTRWAWTRLDEWSGFDVRLAPQLHVVVWGQERCK